MKLSSFVNTGSDLATCEYLGKSMGNEVLEKSGVSDIIKANREGLVPKMVEVHGKHGTYQAVRMVRPGKKQLPAHAHASHKQEEKHSYKKPSPEIQKILEDHEKWLDDPDTGKQADLSGKDLSGLDLKGAYLSEADLEGAKFHGANLEGAEFDGANLTDAEFDGANLKNASFYDAEMEDVSFDGANMKGVKGVKEADMPSGGSLGASDDDKMREAGHRRRDFY